MLKYYIAAIAALALVTPLAAHAQDLPSYAQPAQASEDEQLRGRIVAFDGAYSLQVRDERGYTDNVQLHQGTIINPTGLTLAPGMIVSILGYNGGEYFAANEVDTPYQFVGGYPYYAGHPWNYYGAGISIGFFFGSTGWWHGGAFGGGFRYVGGARVYNSVHVRNIYHSYGGAYRGRDVVAPREHGGYYGGGRRGTTGGARMGGGHGGEGHGGGGDHH